MAREVVSKIDSLQELKAHRITAWHANTQIEDPKPLRTALEIAVGITAAGMGGVIGKVIAGSVTSALLQEFVKSTGKAATQAAVGSIARAATARSSRILTRSAPDEALGDVSTSALASKGDLVACFAEAQTLLASKAEAEQVTAFNLAAESLSDEELADQVQAATLAYEALAADPRIFLRELTMGLMRLKDEVHLSETAEDYGGDRRKMFEKDAEIDETDIRSGNLLLLPLESYALGEYYAPRISAISGFRGLATEVGSATLGDLAGSKIEELPFSLAFRFWGANPFSGLFQDVFCKVWFVKRNDGTIVVDFDDADDDNGLEWLSSYYLGTSRELSDSERRENSAAGARKLYEALKARPLVRASNFDLF